MSTRMERRPQPNLTPHDISRDAWWYEDKGGIIVVQEPRDRTVQIRIPWADLLKAAERCGQR